MLAVSLLTGQPTVVDQNLAVRTAVSGLNAPAAIAFLDTNDYLILERLSGNVKRFHNNTLTTVLDLAVTIFPNGDCSALLCIRSFPRTTSCTSIGHVRRRRRSTLSFR